MSGTLILLQLGGYVGLLLWGTHMVTTGVERGFGAELRQWLGRRLSPPGQAAGSNFVHRTRRQPPP